MVPRPLPSLIFLLWAVSAIAAGESAGAALADLKDGRPWLPALPEVVTPEMAAKMRAFTAAYPHAETRPAGRGVPPGAVGAVERKVAALGLRRDGSGAVVGDRPVLYNGEHGLPKEAPKEALDYFSSIKPVLHELRALYGAAKKDSPEALRLEAQIRLCLEYVASRDWNASNRRVVWVGNGYRVLHEGPGWDLLALAPVLPDPALRARVAENTWWMLDGSTALVEKPGLSTDSLRNTMPQVFAAVAALPDGPAKWQRILALRRALDISVVGNDYNLVAPDGSVIHHEGHHDRYASYSFVPLADLYTKFAAAGFPGEHAAEIGRRFRRAGVVWAWTTLGTAVDREGTPVVPNLRQRVWLRSAGAPPLSGEPGLADFAVAAGRLAAVSGGPDPLGDRELAGLVLAVNPSAAPKAWREAWAAAGFAPEAPSGDLSLPGAGAQIHRRDGWIVLVRGQNRYLRGGEGTGGGFRYTQWGMPSSYGARFCRGSIFIGDCGSPIDHAASGWPLEGFDYSRIPGTTGPVLPPEKMVGGLFYTRAKQGGGCSLLGQGLWAFEDGAIRKSCLLIDDRITFVTEGAVSPEAGEPMRTTVFLAAERTPLPMRVDGEPAPETLERTLSGRVAHTLLDGRSRGYYIHAGGDDVELRRGERRWTNCVAAFYDPSVNPEVGMVSDGYRTALFDRRKGELTMERVNAHPAQFEGPEKLRHFRPSVMRYSEAGYTHEKGLPRADVFTLLMRCDAARLDAFARGMASERPPVVVRASPRLHVFADAASGFRGVCAFGPCEVGPSPASGEVAGVSRACTLLEKSDGDTLRLSVASTDIGDASPFVLRLRGAWEVRAPDPDMRVERAAGATVLRIPYRDMTAREVILTRAPATGSSLPSPI